MQLFIVGRVYCFEDEIRNIIHENLHHTILGENKSNVILGLHPTLNLPKLLMDLQVKITKIFLNLHLCL